MTLATPTTPMTPRTFMPALKDTRDTQGTQRMRGTQGTQGTLGAQQGTQGGVVLSIAPAGRMALAVESVGPVVAIIMLNKPGGKYETRSGATSGHSYSTTGHGS
eukprot:6550347-Alexandrium_andersonii.AAC.1